tara:strand:- start:431 stop:685 length:255 start_codon:yes stop_codon:yes gene_type:complete
MKQCWIYKGSKKEQTYLYVDRENDFEHVPDALLNALGELVLVMNLQLHPQRTLARADVGQVLVELEEKGFFLQMPPSQSELIDI